jgi:hypothetical protein
MVLPSAFKVYECASFKSTTRRVTGGLALFRPTRTPRTPLASSGKCFCFASERVPGSTSTSRSGLTAVSTVGFTELVRITWIVTSAPSRFTCNCSISAAPPAVLCAAPNDARSRSTRTSRVRFITPHNSREIYPRGGKLLLQVLNRRRFPAPPPFYICKRLATATALVTLVTIHAVVHVPAHVGM